MPCEILVPSGLQGLVDQGGRPPLFEPHVPETSELAVSRDGCGAHRSQQKPEDATR